MIIVKNNRKYRGNTMEQTYIDIMIQSLEKKEQVLDRIIELDIKQKNQLNNLDSGFEKLFERTKEELNGHKEDYKEQIRTMQEHIRSITDKSVKIQSQEARNKDLMTLKFASIKKQAREVRVGTQAASRYYKSMSGTGYMEPQFMDNKK